MDNTYLAIAKNDYQYALAVRNLGFNNNAGFTCVNTVEKLFKSVIELTVPDCHSLLRSHNLRNLYRSIRDIIKLDISEGDLAIMSDFYFDTRYPGDDFTEITDDELNMCYDVLGKVYDGVLAWHNTNCKPNKFSDAIKLASNVKN